LREGLLVHSVEHIDLGRHGSGRGFGLAGSAVLRGLFIVVGAGALHRFHWLLDVLGVLLVLTAVRLLRSHASGRPPEAAKNPGVRLVRLFVKPSGLAPARFLVVLAAVEITDLVFALDSLPAVLAVAPNALIAFTSNLFAVAGLRSLYFAVVGLRSRLRFVEAGLALILAFIGARILAARWVEIPTGVSLGIVGAILAGIAAANLPRRVSPPSP